jgi:hypothetical protein
MEKRGCLFFVPTLDKCVRVSCCYEGVDVLYVRLLQHE